MNLKDRIYVAGHNGLVGSAIVNKLTEFGYENIITVPRGSLDLTNQIDVERFFREEKPDYVFDSAAKVGGLVANNTMSAEFVYENLMIQNNIIHNCYRYRVKKLLFLGSICIYPKFADIPIKEDSLLSGKPEPTNDSYSIAKIAGIKMCQAYNKQYNCNFISAMPANVYGPKDRFDENAGHVIPGLIKKFLYAKENGDKSVICWGDGSPTREFLFNSDLADACVFLMNNYNSSEIINVGIDNEITIKELAYKIKNIIGFSGEIIWDTEKPNGVLRRKICNEKMKKMGWSPKIDLDEGLEITIDWYMKTRG